MRNTAFWDVRPFGCYNDVSEENIVSINRVERINKLGTLATALFISFSLFFNY
jgi:hypothetical protein